MKDRLSTNEFAKMCKTQKRTLFYYDEINILKPVETLENGYRMYSPNQFDSMSMIKALQSVGMSLNEIKSLMNETDIIKCKNTLSDQAQLLKQKIIQLQQSEYALNETIANINKYTEMGCDKPFYEECNDSFLITHKMPDNGLKFINYLTFGYYSGVIMDKNNSKIPDLVYKKSADRNSGNFLKKSGKYISVYKKILNGDIGSAIDSWEKLNADKNIAVTDNLYIESVTNDFLFSLKKENIFKFSFKIINNHPA